MNLPQHIGLEYFSISFIKGELESIKEELGDIIPKAFGTKWTRNEYFLNENIDIVDFISGSYFNKIQCLIWRPKSIESDFVAFISNMPDGWPTLLNYYLKHYDRDLIRVRLSDENKNYPVYQMEYLNKTWRRVVQVLKDSDKWTFYQEGSPLMFEDVENYKKRKISDRLNEEIIQDYLKKNGIDISKTDFWNSKGLAIEFCTELINKNG